MFSFVVPVLRVGLEELVGVWKGHIDTEGNRVREWDEGRGLILCHEKEKTLLEGPPRSLSLPV